MRIDQADAASIEHFNALLQRRLKLRQRLHRAGRDDDISLVVVVTHLVGEIRTGDAGRHQRDVVEELPNLVDRLVDIE